MKKKFTIIELLVVVAIIGILLSLLIPGLAKAREKTRQAVCLSNQSQSMRASLLYSNNNNNSLIPSNHNPVNPRSNFRDPAYDLRNYLKDYINDYSIWRCESLSFADPLDGVNTRGIDYSTYLYFPGSKRPVFVVGETVPLKSFLVGEYVTLQDVVKRDWIHPGLHYNHGTGVVEQPLKELGNHSLARKGHGKPYGANLTFGDGHGKWYHYKSLKNVGSDITGKTRNVYSMVPE